MKYSQKYPLAITGASLLTLIAQSILLAPHTQNDLFASLSGVMLVLVGMVFHFLGVFLFASVLLSYSRPVVTWVYLSVAFVFVWIGFEFFRVGYRVEGFIVLVLALSLFLCNWLHLKFDWLVEAIQWANLLLGACLLLRPALFMPSPVYAQFQPITRLAFGAIFLLTSFTSLLISLFPALAEVKVGRILALPWVFWVLMFITPTHLANLSLVVIVALWLIVGEYIPWEKLVLVHAADLGRRFLHLLVSAQVIFLGLVSWVIYLVETGGPIQAEKLLEIRLVAFLSYNILTLLGILVMASVSLSINGLYSSLNGKTCNVTREPNHQHQGVLRRFADTLLAPFDRSQNILREYIVARQEYESLHVKQMMAEKRRMAQLNLLHQLNLELESVLDPPVSAQLTANAIFNALGGALVAVLQYDHKQDELVAIAISGPQSSSVPPGYRQKVGHGLVGRAARLRRTQLASDTRLDPDYFKLERQLALSEVVVPLMQRNRIKGMILVDSQDANVFDDSDIRTLETVAVQLVTSWERSDHDERLTNLIGAGITLSTTLDVDGEIKEIAQIARSTLDARFIFVALADRNGGFTRTAYEGHAPTLLSILNSDPAGNTLIQDVINSHSALRVRDVRKRYTSTPTGSHELRSLLAVPIRVRQSSIGAILAFGKMGNISFSENDESLISLLASQAAAAVESTWLYQELRTMLSTATQLYTLSIRIIQSEQLTDSAAAIAETAHKLSKGAAAGIVLTPSKDTEVRVQIDSDGLHPGAQHPMDLIEQAMESGQTIIFSGANQTARVVMPLQTSRGHFGALWVQVPEQYWSNARYTDNLHTLANQAAIALERSLLIMQTRKQAVEIEAAYHELEMTYDQTLGALSSALDARDRETEGHSLRVARIAYRLGLRIGLTLDQAKTLERGSILHDIGKIGISDTILLKPGPLSEQEWQVMREHPDIGARIIEGIPFLQDTLPVIRFHQERWDGSGYPIGLKGHEIPLMARIFAIVDAFDALTNDRPYRKRSPVSDSMAFLREKADILFDPVLVQEFEAMIKDGELASLA